MAVPKNAHHFIPRRDIVIENKPSAPEKSPNTSTASRNNPAYPKKSTFPNSQFFIHPLLIVLLLWLIPNIRGGKNKHYRTSNTGLEGTYITPDTVVRMLSDVSPYLGKRDQENIQVLVGAMEAVDILKSIREGTYQNSRIQRTMDQSLSVQDKILGIIRALKPYLPSDNHEAINKVIQTYSAINKVSENLVRYSSKAYQNSESDKATDRVAKIIETIIPIIPSEQQQRLNQVKNLVKMYGTIESSNLWEKWTQQEQKQVEASETSKDNSTKKSDSGTGEQKNIVESLKSTLNPEQSQAIDIMMKMAQLLSQKSTDEKSENE